MVSISRKKIKYSTTEEVLLSLLPKREGSITSSELADRLYDGKNRQRPRTALQSVAAMMSMLSKKVDLNKESFQIVKAARSGPNLMEYRKVMR